MKPTVGRIVHFYEDGQGPFPAIVTVVINDTCCMLSVFKPGQTSVYLASSCLFNDSNASQYWVWPPRE